MLMFNEVNRIHLFTLLWTIITSRLYFVWFCSRKVKTFLFFSRLFSHSSTHLLQSQPFEGKWRVILDYFRCLIYVWQENLAESFYQQCFCQHYFKIWNIYQQLFCYNIHKSLSSKEKQSWKFLGKKEANLIIKDESFTTAACMKPFSPNFNSNKGCLSKCFLKVLLLNKAVQNSCKFYDSLYIHCIISNKIMDECCWNI